MKRRKSGSGVSSATCDACGLRHPSTVKGKRHRRCGGSAGSEIRPKHSIASKRGTWR